ncbi:MAG: damage-inducible protein DinB [Ignavibacteria bacterium]|nr:damage-inducible protein DinB [Ignavibacteria bacterium]
MKEHFAGLLKYDHWANNVIMDAFDEDAPAKAVTLMSHIFNACDIWADRLSGIIPQIHPWAHTELTMFRDRLELTTGKLDLYISTVDNKMLFAGIKYLNTKGEEFKSTPAEILTHLFNHSTYHRGQIAMLLKEKYGTAPVTDYIHYSRSIERS